MNKKIINIFVMVVYLLICSTNVSADSEISVISTKVNDNIIATYINSDITDCTAMIGTSLCEVTSYIRAGDMPSETLILVDTSGSIPKDIQEKTDELLSTLIDGKNENEKYAIASFGTDITYLCDYTSDRYELAKAIENLEYNESYTYIYSTLDNVLSDISDSVFTKIVIISDGVENSKDGITYDEILRTVSDVRCPIYAIGIENKNQENLKKFYAFSRNSNAESYTLTSDTNISEVIGIVNESRDYTCINITIPDGVADGSVKYLKISGADFECGADVRMPVIAAEQVETSISETYTSIETTQEDTQVSTPEKSEDKTSIIVICGLVAVAVIVVIIVILIVKSKKEETEQSEPTSVEPGSVPTKITPPSTLIGDHTIKLTDINAPEHSYRCALGQGVIVGRDPKQCMITIDYDGYISRRHLKIFCEDGKFYIENVSGNQNVVINDKSVLEKVGASQENKPASGTRILVQQNNKDSTPKAEIFSGDIIKIGHTSLRIEIS